VTGSLADLYRRVDACTTAAALKRCEADQHALAPQLCDADAQALAERSVVARLRVAMLEVL
jgi:hypothetical protein